jgi:hypothetical protein
MLCFKPKPAERFDYGILNPVACLQKVDFFPSTNWCASNERAACLDPEARLVNVERFGNALDLNHNRANLSFKIAVSNFMASQHLYTPSVLPVVPNGTFDFFHSDLLSPQRHFERSLLKETYPQDRKANYIAVLVNLLHDLVVFGCAEIASFFSKVTSRKSASGSNHIFRTFSAIGPFPSSPDRSSRR